MVDMLRFIQQTSEYLNERRLSQIIDASLLHHRKHCRYEIFILLYELNQLLSCAVFYNAFTQRESSVLYLTVLVKQHVQAFLTTLTFQKM